jgi:hypothetical protein
MPTTVDIPGVGLVDFPDSMSGDQVNTAAAKLYQDHSGPHAPNSTGSLTDAEAHQAAVDAALSSISPEKAFLLKQMAAHPKISAALGGIVGSVLGGPAGGWGGMVAGGALGAAGANAYSQLAQQAIESPEAPQTGTQAATEIGKAGLEGAVTGATGAGALKTAPTIIRAVGSPLGMGAIAGGATLAKTGDPIRSIEAASVAAMGGKALQEVSGPIASAVERLALKARIGHALIREAPEAVAAVEQGAKAATKAVAPVIKQAAQTAKEVPTGDLLRWTNAGLPGREIVGLMRTNAGLTEAEAERQLIKFNQDVLPGIRAAERPAAPVAAQEVSAAPAVAPGEPQTFPSNYAPPPEPTVQTPMPPQKASIILPDGQRAMPTNYGGHAKPGPLPPTPPDQVEAALRQSIGNPNVGPRPGGGMAHPNPLTAADNMLGDVIKWKQVGLPKAKIVSLMKDQYGVDAPQAEKALSMIEEKWPSIVRDEAPVGGGSSGDLSSILTKSIDAVKASKGKVKAQEALADELSNKIMEWKKMGYSSGQMQDSMSQIYKIPKGTGKKMIDMTLKAYGVQ